MKERRGIIKLGDNCSNSYERTDPDYIDKRQAALLADYKECPADWKPCFLSGLNKRDYDFIKENLKL